MNPKDAAKVAASAGTNGLIPAATATGMMIGTTTAAEAVFEVVSEITIASSTANTVMAKVLVSPSRSAEPLPMVSARPVSASRSEEHTSELQSRQYLVCRLLLEKKNHDQMTYERVE